MLALPLAAYRQFHLGDLLLLFLYLDLNALTFHAPATLQINITDQP